MYILAIETTGAHASCAVINEYGQVHELHSDGILNHLQNSIPMISNLLRDYKLTIDDIDVIAASEGPGSFTGIRIGVATARALAQAAGKPVISVPTLKTFVYHKSNTGDTTDKDDTIVCPIFDARRNQIYGGAYHNMREIVAGGAYMLEEYLCLLQRAAVKARTNDICQLLFFGDGISQYGEKVQTWAETLPARLTVTFADEHVRLQNASSVAKLALELYKNGEAKPYEELHPNYMRKAEAERQLEAGTLGIKSNESFIK